MPYKNAEKRKEYGREYQKHLYEKDKTPFLLRGKLKKERLRQHIREARNQPCTDCCKTYPWYVMEFDHRDPSQKLGAVQLQTTWKKLVEEMNKCDVVCANCHAVRTYKRRAGIPILAEEQP